MLVYKRRLMGKFGKHIGTCKREELNIKGLKLKMTWNCSFQGGASFVNPYAIYVSCLSLLCCKAEFLALLCLIFSCVIVTCPYGDLGQVWYLIVSFPDLCLHLNFHSFFKNSCQSVTIVATPILW